MIDPESPDGGKPCALLVEDSDLDALVVTRTLDRFGRFQVTRASTLGKAVDALSNGVSYDVIVLDLTLPDSAGLATFQHLHRRYPDIPIVILSGAEDDATAISAVAAGAQDYIPKSKSDAELLERTLRYAIERHGRQQAEQRNVLLERDLAVAGEVQRHLLPSVPPSIPGLEIASRCQSAAACAGDFYDFIEAPNGQVDVVVADVSSHGFGPALIMAGTRRMLRTTVQLSDDIGRCVTLANEAVCEDTLAGQFVTLFYGRIDPASVTMTYCAAGHPGWIIRANGEVEFLRCKGLPLGLLEQSRYRVDGAASLDAGDFVLLATDGCWEAANADEELFGTQRMLDIATKSRHMTASAILTQITQAVSRFSGSAQLLDDMTIVVLKVVQRSNAPESSA